MHLVSLQSCPPFTTADGSTIREVFNPRNSALLNGSLACATLQIGQKTTRHFHPKAEEIYFVLKGRGLMEIDGERVEMGEGDAVAIPSGARHQIEALGSEALEFLCCCAPAYSHEDTVLCDDETSIDN
ncbi:cupin domain-containing protein [bacterium]|nr:MAG: cupin domain-containing protein [bacterium]